MSCVTCTDQKFVCDAHPDGCGVFDCTARRRYCPGCTKFPNVDSKTHCSDCGEHWDEHDFGVPKPFCPPAPEPKTVGLIIRCNWCAAILEHPGALLFTPPDRVGQCVKIHLCSGCFSVVLRDSQAAAVKIARLESEFKDLQAERGAWSTAWEILTGAREGQAHLPDAIVRAARQTTAEINRLIVDRSQLAVKLETVKRTVREALSDARRNVSTMAEMQGHGVQTRADGVRRAVAWIEGLVGDVTREGADGPESVRGETLALAAPIALTALTAPAAPVTSERDEPVSSSDAARRTP